MDFRVKSGPRIAVIEVKSGARHDTMPGMAAFDDRFHPGRKILVGQDGIPVEEFLTRRVTAWIEL